DSADENDGTQPEVFMSDPVKDAEDAILRYQEVLEIDEAKPLIRFNAMLGMAGAHEELKQWDQAKTLYETVQADAAKNFPILSIRAKNRLAMLPRLDEPVI